jgi:bifunctional DNA-binding transcriptional regulator/antitoxin component of YhaV-PrlF toxin-antitoxin module
MKTVLLQKDGEITLPATFLRKYGLKDGDTLEIYDLEDGSFFLSPHHSKVSELGDKIREELEASGETLESLLADLDETRKSPTNHTM